MPRYTEVPISSNLRLRAQAGHPGSLLVTIENPDDGAAQTLLSPSEADHLVIYALSMTKPEGVASDRLADAVNAVRLWQKECAEIWQRETLDAERNRILQDAGLSRHWEGCTPATRALVDMVIAERRKAEQK